MADRVGLPFELRHKKINITNNHPPFPHEALAHQKLFAATLSVKEADSATQTLSASKVFDKGAKGDLAYLTAVTEMVAMVVIDKVYGGKIDGKDLLGVTKIGKERAQEASVVVVP